MPMSLSRSLRRGFRLGQLGSIRALFGHCSDDIAVESTSSVANYSLRRASMAGSGSRDLLGRSHWRNDHVLDAVFGESDDLSCSIGWNRQLKNRGHGDSDYAYCLLDLRRRSCKDNPFVVGAGLRAFHSSSLLLRAAGAASDLSFHGSESSEVSTDQKIMSDRPLKLISGSCYLPHPDKEATGGEDAYFLCLDEQVIGLADGVGQWAESGVNAGQYSRELMANAVAVIQEEPKDSIDPARVLEKAYSRTKAKGSSTACIIALTSQGLRAVNLGDSGFTVIRDGCTIFRSPVQQHAFNMPYQLQSGGTSDLPSSGQVFTIPVEPGDVIVAATDGLFDNLYSNDITAVVVHGVRARFEPQVIAQKIAALARQRALDKNRQTPYSTAAQDAGFRVYGGKLDDITVIVSCIAPNNL
ncbi:hypothetical protein Syun_015714 [Stephania yunnanensis]|uniref:Protein phosphatase n=1 Tax=Stephania yunnanensis TaxID=152371 RepID=A0AAP0JM90_9MAGN